MRWRNNYSGHVLNNDQWIDLRLSDAGQTSFA